jgi:hypothetical protein
MYVLTGLGVLVLGVSRYTTPTPRDRVDELAAVRAAELHTRRAALPDDGAVPR